MFGSETHSFYRIRQSRAQSLSLQTIFLAKAVAEGHGMGILIAISGHRPLETNLCFGSYTVSNPRPFALEADTSAKPQQSAIKIIIYNDKIDNYLSSYCRNN
jgi:hypothetical protein